ncbi:MAG: transporter substrate-binding domain-containing protein [Oscillospiraceae bacterium]|mgnify:FL=1|nr:transporter substrate-binding domain-containing protein [Oscillospiraceae bacterium]
MKKGLSLLLSGCLMLGMLAGCGSSAASSAAPAESAAPAASEAATAAPAAPAPAASEAETSTPETGAATTNSDKTWVIATDTVFKPFEYTDESGNFVGIDVDIVAAIAEDQGFKYELKSLGWDAAIAACQAGQADGMIAGASITDERKESGWMFSDGYYTATQCMAVAENSDIKGFADLKDKQVAVKTGTQGASYAESLKDEYGFTLNYFEDSPTMYQAVAGGQAVACFEDTPIMAASIKDGGLGLKIVEGTENEGADYGFAVFNSDEQELLDMFNAGLANIKANGKYDEIIAKYLG